MMYYLNTCKCLEHPLYQITPTSSWYFYKLNLIFSLSSLTNFKLLQWQRLKPLMPLSVDETEEWVFCYTKKPMLTSIVRHSEICIMKANQFGIDTSAQLNHCNWQQEGFTFITQLLLDIFFTKNSFSRWAISVSLPATMIARKKGWSF